MARRRPAFTVSVSRAMKVSVITCSFNHGQFIEHTIASVVSQNRQDLEYVVVDGASTDNTLDILKSYGDRIKWISEPDTGQSEAVNKGIQMTTGEIVGWLNSDDLYYVGAIEHVAEFFAANSDIDVVYGNADYIDIDGNAYATFPTQPWDPIRFQSNCFICQPATFLRRTVVERYGLLDTNLHYCMDYEYWLRLAQAGVRFAHLDRKLAAARMYAANKTLRSRPACCTEINQMLLNRIGFVPDAWIYDYTQALMAEKGRLDGNARRVYYERELRAMRYAFSINGRISRHMRDEIPWRLRQARLLKWVPRGAWNRLVTLVGGKPNSTI
jgi:glycosyltransferase involved in cell wall biosynthesis